MPKEVIKCCNDDLDEKRTSMLVHSSLILTRVMQAPHSCFAINFTTKREIDIIRRHRESDRLHTCQSGVKFAVKRGVFSNGSYRTGSSRQTHSTSAEY